MPNLKPCPFCGAEAKIKKGGAWGCGDGTRFYSKHIVCSKCDAFLDGRGRTYAEAEEDVIRQWNRRHGQHH